MASYPNTITMSILELLELTDRYYDEPPLGQGWGKYKDMECDQCGFIWDAVKPIGSRGLKCPRCGHYDREFLFLPKAGAMPSDGCWLQPVGWQKARICYN